MTNLFRERCNSMLNLFANRNAVNNRFGDEEYDVIDRLIADNKIRYEQDDDKFYRVNLTPYEGELAPLGPINPMVLELAGEAPENEYNLRVYRKSGQLVPSRS